MKQNLIAKKTIAIWSVLLLILSFNLSLNVSAEIIQDDDDGVAFDEFNNAEDIKLKNCNFSNGSIRLENREFETKFDRQETPNKVDAWKFASMFVMPGNEGIAQYLSRLYTPEILIGAAEEYTIGEYKNIEDNDDDLVVDTEALRGIGGKPEWPLNLFRFETNVKRGIVQEFVLAWNLGEYQTGTNLEEISMYVWSYGDLLPHWTWIKTVNYLESEINATSGEVASVRRNSDFFSENGILDMLIVGKPTPTEVVTTLTTDYVMLGLTVKEGFVPKGNVTSSKIKPINLSGWERVIWSGSRPSANSDVTIKILDGNRTVIEALDGNSEGFTYSPIDITSLDIVIYPEIRLKAFLRSDNIKFSPRFNSWGVLWQTMDGFFDSFTYNFRINESYGVKIEGGKINISEFYSDWTIFGKNPDNSRSYVGQELKIGTNYTYWYTPEFSEYGYGGGFRSPVVKDGKVYISSSNEIIYTFNLITDDPDDEHNPIDNSISNYSVDCSLGVTDDYVIVPTSKTSKLGIINQIYALNRSDLKEIVWDYGTDDFTDPICFSSSPTIANDRIFITSWSGRFANSPEINYMYSKIHNFLVGYGVSLGVNNKLIGLDINGGELWNPINLPAASFCTPAVHNGLVYVGCENYEGSSFFAYDENSGEEIWNATVGLVGRSSPVVGDGKVFIIGRDQSLFSFKGNDTIYALDAETGEEIWNLTIGNSTNSFSSFLRTYNIDNRMSSSFPISTPAYYDQTLFVLAPEGILYALNSNNGAEKWSFDAASEASKGSLGFNVLPHHTASPLVVDDIVYVATTQHGYVFALDNSNKGEIKWEYQIRDPDYDPLVPQTHYIFASPVMTDGLILISENQLDIDDLVYRNRLQCIGNYEPNLRGKAISVPIHVQRERWWNQFNATTSNTDENNSIVFSILDENGIVLKSELDGNNNNLMNIKDNFIQLCAELIIGNASEPLPMLDQWEISWNIEDRAPEFIANSFKAGEGVDGWINLIELPECSIDVRDIGVNKTTSGIDMDSAEYYIEYIKDGSEVISEGFDAVSNKESGATEATIIAEIAKDLEGINVKELKNILFKVRDLAGNENISQPITFKLDNVKPSSEIKDAEDYVDKYNSIQIEAVGDDDESGIISIALYYRVLGDIDWTPFGSKKSPYIWSFENNTSAEYEFCTIATDKAGNVESFPSSGDVDFIFDMNPPLKPDFENFYTFETLPDFSLTFEDDYELLSVEYRLNLHGENEWINISEFIYDKTYEAEWALEQSDWDRMFEDVKHTMHFRITDICRNEYVTPSDLEALNLSKDIIPPITADVSIVLTEFEEGGWDDQFTITAILPLDMEYEYVSLYYQYSSNNKDYSDWERYGDELSETPFKWDFLAEEGSGYYKFKTSIYNQGEIVESTEKIINISIFPTTLVIILTFLIFILLLFVIISIRKMKKR